MNSRHVKLAICLAIAVAGATGIGNPAYAAEGSTGPYLLGSRDLAIGIVPPPGVYFASDNVFVDASVRNASIGGLALEDIDLEILLFKPNITFVPKLEVLGGRAGINIAVPIAYANVDFNAVIGNVLNAGLSDSEFGVGDPIVTPMIGWDAGNLHVSLSAPMFLPVGEYEKGSVSLGPPVDVDVLSIGKNKFAIHPNIAATYLDMETGLEVSGAVGVTFNWKNEATDYKSGDELIVEASVAKHFQSGFTLGAMGYFYQQLNADSGSGADSFADALGVDEIQGRVIGAGPIATYSTKIDDVGLTLKAKYLHDFDNKQHFKTDSFWFVFIMAF